MADEKHPCTDDYWWEVHKREMAAAKKSRAAGAQPDAAETEDKAAQWPATSPCV